VEKQLKSKYAKKALCLNATKKILKASEE